MRRNHRRPLSSQIRLLAIFIVTISTAIFGVLIYFQIYRGEHFSQTSQRNCLRHKTVDSLRGAILDRHGKALATNRPVTALVWHGTGNKQFNESQTALVERLHAVLTVPLPETETLLSIENRGEEYILCPDLSFEQLCCVMEQCPQGPNLLVKAASMRFYPYDMLACHIIGYFRGTSLSQGTFGLERMYEEQLRGEPGELTVIVNAVGRSLEAQHIREARDGNTLQTTLDFEIQSIAESIFSEEQIGALIAMDPHDGDLLAVVSRPAFNPNMFVGPVDHETWKRCVEQKPFINRAFSACYPPASLFKLIVTAAALEEGIVTPYSCWNCTGSITLGNAEFHCNRDRVGHGHIIFEEAIAQSCNIPFYDIGKHIQIDRIAHYAKKFGLGTFTGVSLPEKAGFMPTASWKKQQLHESWRKGETLQVCIGQSYTTVTPLQIARMIGGIFTGKLVTPRILTNEPITKQDVGVSARTRHFIQDAMKSVILHGSGKILCSLQDMDIYGKTGTAQTHHRSKHGWGDAYLPHGWFACYAQHKDHPPIVLVIMVEHAGSSSVSTKLAKQFLASYRHVLEKPSSSETILTPEKT